jgi:hypothetical protein
MSSIVNKEIAIIQNKKNSNEKRRVFLNEWAKLKAMENPEWIYIGKDFTKIEVPDTTEKNKAAINNNGCGC